MHPAIAYGQLEGLSREIATVLGRAIKPVRQVEIMGRLSRRVSQSTVSRTMAQLIADDIVVKTGRTRDANFALSPGASLFARPPQLRPRVDYNPEIIEKYKINETRWLSENARTRMRDAASAVQHNLDASTYSRQIAERFLIDLSWASSSLEGNTYNYLDTEALIKFGQEASGHDLTEATMILNHKRAIMVLLENLDRPLLDPDGIGRLHALLMRDILSTADLGRVRGSAVGIGGSAYRPSTDVDKLRSDLGSLLWKVEHTRDPFEASFMLLAGIPYLQPFADGNKRIGRLACNIPLLRAGLPPMSFIAVDKAHYLLELIIFYETHDLTLLADVMAAGYADAAPTYMAAVSSTRVPRSIEVRERERIEQAIQHIVAATLRGGDATVGNIVGVEFKDLPEKDRAVVTDSIQETLRSLNEVNAIAWGVLPEAAAQYASRRTD